MGKRNKRYEEEEEERVVACEVCENEIPFDFYLTRGDMLSCDECGAEYIIKSCNPVRILLLLEEKCADNEDDYFNDYSDSLSDDLYDGRGYD